MCDMSSTALADKGYSDPLGLRCGVATTATGNESGAAVKACIWEAESFLTPSRLPWLTCLVFDCARGLVGGAFSVRDEGRPTSQPLGKSSIKGDVEFQFSMVASCLKAFLKVSRLAVVGMLSKSGKGSIGGVGHCVALRLAPAPRSMLSCCLCFAAGPL
ncbi:hypothetical protein RRF57_011072 [Xylaria bambusicola]|uniref:Uncharacterized protein n=1 Tax=Xylaria bambusicola TaxID=326684 RepID=A0AAN7ZCW5_9PEZI